MQKQSTPFDQFLLHKLNDAQRNAVTHVQSPVLVVAGAGSGKTRVITARIAHLMIDHAATQSSIVALTFTNKAAREMKQRIGSFLPDGQSLPFVGTFHAYCLQLLKRYGSFLDDPFISVMDMDDQQKMITAIIKQYGAQKIMTPKNVLYKISHIKNNRLHMPLNHLFADCHPIVQELYSAYEQEKKASKVADFDDLLLYACALFENESFKTQFQETVKHILIDEYQDTNRVQHTLLKHMALRDSKCVADTVCAVGDEDQSIYSWRGATVANMADFCTDFPDTVVIKVEQNYRSVQPILTAANKVIAHNSVRNPKKLWSDKKGVDCIRVMVCNSEYQEADAIGALLKLCMQEEKLSSIAILYRTHMQSRALEEACVKRSVPYKIVGGVQFYERKEIKDLLAYLKLLVNPHDRTSCLRVINCPARGLGPAFEELLIERWQHEPFYRYDELMRGLIQHGIIKGVKETAVKQFMHCFHELNTDDAPSNVLERIILNTNYFSHLKNNYDTQDAETRIANVKELVNAARYLESEKNIRTCAQFLDEIALMQDKAEVTNQEHQAVTLMTLHAAKGLEFDIVILAGLEDGILPSTRSLTSQEAIEEERRLLYVGMTRARERLLLSYCRYRYTYGKMIDQRISRFMQEIPAELVAEYDMRQNELYHGSFFPDWLGIKSQESRVMTFGNKKVTVTASPTRVIPRMPHSTHAVSRGGKVSIAKKNSQARKKGIVQHKKYGVGVVQKIEPQSDGSSYVTAQFKCGVKKILDTYLQHI